MESTRVFARIETVTAVVTVVCMFIEGSFSTASGQGIDRCDPTSVKECYISYKEALWWNEFKPSPEGVYDEEEFKRGCSRFKDKLQCDDDQANCTDVVKGAYSIQERGYEAMRDIICDSKTVKDFHSTFKCRDDTKLIECAQNLKPAPGPQNRGVPTTGLDYCRFPCQHAQFHQRRPHSVRSRKGFVRHQLTWRTCRSNLADRSSTATMDTSSWEDPLASLQARTCTALEPFRGKERGESNLHEGS